MRDYVVLLVGTGQAGGACRCGFFLVNPDAVMGIKGRGNISQAINDFRSVE